MRKRALTAVRRTLAVLALAALGVAVSTAVAQEPGSTQTTTAPTTAQTNTVPTPSGEQGDGLVEIRPADESEPIVLSLDDVEGSVDTHYRVRDENGDVERVEITPDNGAAINDFLEAVDLDGEGYTYVIVDGVPISRTRLRAWLQPAVYVDDEGTHFLRPIGDSKDEFKKVTVTSGPLVVEQTNASRLRLKVEASPEEGEAKEPVTFTVRIRGGGVGDSYEIKWRFGDGERAAGKARVRHRFEEPGSYRVEVTVHNPHDFGRSAVKIPVGEAEESDENREGGGTNEDDAAPTSGPYDGDSGSGDSSSNFDYSPDDYSADDYGYEPYDPAPAPDPAPVPSGPKVAGNVLADISAAPSSSAVERAVRAGTFVPEDPVDPAGVPTAAWALGGAIALLGMGAGMESGRPRRLRPLQVQPLLRRLLRR